MLFLAKQILLSMFFSHILTFLVLCPYVQSQVPTTVSVVITKMTLLVSDLVVNSFHVRSHLCLGHQNLSTLRASTGG